MVPGVLAIYFGRICTFAPAYAVEMRWSPNVEALLLWSTNKECLWIGLEDPFEEKMRWPIFGRERERPLYIVYKI